MAEWVELRIVVPEAHGQRILSYLRAAMQFRQLDDDWCTEKRDVDRATVSYGPVPEPPDRRENW
jgi:hypothetical protein